MENEKTELEVWSIWIDWERRVISFHEAEGFEKVDFRTHKEMFHFAVEKGFDGFAIQ